MIGENDIKRIFEKQLGNIKDKRYVDVVVKTWVSGCKKGGWESVEELMKMPFTLLTDTFGVDFVEHTIAVTEGALGLAQAQMTTYRQMPYRVNLDRLIAGGLLHDVGKLLETQKDGSGGYKKSRNGMCARHPVSGTILAAEAGADQELLNVIACHAKEGEGAPKTLETILIHQADFSTFDPLVMLSKNQLIQ